MAEVKISQLSSGEALGGTEVVPIVQNGATVKIKTQAIADLSGSSPTWAFPTIDSNHTIYSVTGFSGVTDISFAYKNLKIGFEINLRSNIEDYDTYTAAQVSFSQGTNTDYINITDEAIGQLSVNNTTDCPIVVDTDIINLIEFNYGVKGDCYINARYIGNLGFQFYNLGTLNCPNALLMEYMYVGPSTTNFTAPNLLCVQTLKISSANAYTGTFELPSCQYIQSWQSFFASMTTISLPDVRVISSKIDLYKMNGLQNFSFPNLQSLGGSFVANNGPTLNQTTVDHILTKLASLDGGIGTEIYQNQTVNLGGGNSAPSSIGLNAKSILISRGCSVTTN